MAEIHYCAVLARLMSDWQTCGQCLNREEVVVSEGWKVERDYMRKRQAASRDRDCTQGRKLDCSLLIMDISSRALILFSLLCSGNDNDFILISCCGTTHLAAVLCNLDSLCFNVCECSMHASITLDKSFGQSTGEIVPNDACYGDYPEQGGLPSDKASNKIPLLCLLC